MQPMCSVGMEGFAMERLYFGDAFKRYGVGVQTASAGKYKSAPDTFAQNHMRPEDREQSEAFLADVWTTYKGMIAESRKVHAATLDSLSANKGVLPARDALAAKLVDRVAYRDELATELEKIVGKNSDGDSFSQVALIDYIRSGKDPAASSAGVSPQTQPTVAVEYIEGDIVNGDGAWDEAGADRICDDLRSLRNDKNVKAVVLRVNSPGGDAIAADRIRREVELVGKKCPVVVSMGRMAASGGYWVSAPAKCIYAEPTAHGFHRRVLDVHRCRKAFRRLRRSRGQRGHVAVCQHGLDLRAQGRTADGARSRHGGRHLRPVPAPCGQGP
jgi:protease-4